MLDPASDLLGVYFLFFQCVIKKKHGVLVTGIRPSFSLFLFRPLDLFFLQQTKLKLPFIYFRDPITRILTERYFMNHTFPTSLTTPSHEFDVFSRPHEKRYADTTAI